MNITYRVGDQEVNSCSVYVDKEYPQDIDYIQGGDVADGYVFGVIEGNYIDGQAVYTIYGIDKDGFYKEGKHIKDAIIIGGVAHELVPVDLVVKFSNIQILPDDSGLIEQRTEDAYHLLDIHTLTSCAYAHIKYPPSSEV